MPERGQIFRKLMESAAAMAGVKLRVEWEVSSVPAILDLVSAGIGHATLAEDAIRPFPHLKRLAVTPIVQPGIKITLCLVTPAQRRATPLRQRTAELLVNGGSGVGLSPLNSQVKLSITQAPTAYGALAPDTSPSTTFSVFATCLSGFRLL
jgi:hypothetical protein